MSAPFRLDRSFDFEVGPDRFWSVISRTADYRSWWSWLRHIDADELREGTVARCLVRGPVPYDLRLVITVRRLVPTELLDTAVAGDLEGWARLELAPTAGGCRVRLVWEVGPRARIVRATARAARPLVQWGQDWVVATGARQFARRALG